MSEKKPIAVISSYDAYRHLCYHCNLNQKNPIFWHVPEERHAAGMEFSGYVVAGDYTKVKDIDRVELMVKTRIR